MTPVAIITGGSRGIGLGIARTLASSGWNLMLSGLRPNAAVAEVLSELSRSGVTVKYTAGDISQEKDRQTLVENTLQHFGAITSLINNAGITSPGRKDLLDADEGAFDQVISTNLKGPFFLTQMLARYFRDQPRSEHAPRRSVVFVSSVSAELVSTNRGDYCLSKTALGMATQLWAARLAEYDVDVYEVRPGVIRTDMTAGVQEKYDRLISGGLTLEKRWGNPEDVGKAVKALVTGEIPYATGQVLKIDGGMTIHSL